MTFIEPTNKEAQEIPKNKRYSVYIRLWHWLNFIVISGSLATVLINATITDNRNVSGIISTELQKNGVSLTAQQGKSAAHALSDSVWAVHIYFGYVLAALFLFRIILEFFELADQKLIRKIKAAYHQYHVIKQNRMVARHELTVKSLYATFYVLLFIMVITGLFLAFEDALVAYRSIRHSVKEVHGFCMYLILAFIFVHLLGVIMAEQKDGRGIVSDMINGGDSSKA